jgi:hypothetical protein
VNKKRNNSSRRNGLSNILVVLTLLYLLIVGTWLVFSDRILNETSKSIIGQLLAICAAYQGLYWPGKTKLTYKRSTSLLFEVSGAGAIYIVSLWWWQGAKSPVYLSSITVREETASFAASFERALAEFRASISKEFISVQNRPALEREIQRSIQQARADIESFRSSHKLTQAENRLLDNLSEQLPSEIGEKRNREADESPLVHAESVTNNHFITEIVSPYTPTNSPRGMTETNRLKSSTNATVPSVMEHSLVSGEGGRSAVTGGAENVRDNSAVSTPLSSTQDNSLPSVVSNALAANWDSWVSKYPFGFTVQYQMQNFGPYNAQNVSPYSFNFTRGGRPDLAPLPRATGPVFLPTLNYQNYRLSKPAHSQGFTGRYYETANGETRLRRPWHVVPVTTYVEAVDSQLFVIGNGPGGDWDSMLFNSIQPHFYFLDQYFPDGFYMVTTDGRELNFFRARDPNYSALWSSTIFAPGPSRGWTVTFPPQFLNSREVQIINIPNPNQLETVTIDGNSIGIVVYLLQSGPAAFMGVKSN